MPSLSCLSCTKGLFFVLLTAACILAFLAHSVVFILLYSEQSDRTETTKYQMSQLILPSVVICNKIPYNQAGLNTINSNLNQGYILRYIRQWLDPSLAQTPDFIQLSSAEMSQADQVIQSTFPTGNRVQKLEQIMNQCQDVINSCSFAGQSLSSFDCCQFIKPYVGTVRGVCWVFDNDKMVQADVDPSQGLQIVFRVTRNSFYSNDNMTTHPGIDVYLMNNSMEATRLATELGKPITLKDKKGVRIAVRKQFESDLRRIDCGVHVAWAAGIDQDSTRNTNNLAFCLLQQVQQSCGCAPLFASFLSLDIYRFGQFSQQINQSAACSVSVYETCAKKILFYATPDNWDNPIRSTASSQVQDAVSNCRKNSHTPCQIVRFPGDVVEYDLPADYRYTQDYVSQLSVFYGSFMATNVVDSRNPNLSQFVSNIGYSIGLWFAVGHIIWTLTTTPCNWFCSSRPRSAKVSPTPSKPLVQPSPASARRSELDTHSLKPSEGVVEPAKPPDEAA